MAHRSGSGAGMPYGVRSGKPRPWFRGGFDHADKAWRGPPLNLRPAGNASRLAKSRAIGEEASFGAGFTMIECVWAVAFRFSLYFVTNAKRHSETAI